MGKHAQIVIGPAGSGKSTYCSAMHKHFTAIKRPVHLINLDPAAEAFDYPVSIDIRELISLEDVMEELGYGPNGGLIYCMEYLVDNLDWLADQIGDYSDDYLIFDCPGQIELYSHLPVMKRITDWLQQQSYRVCAVYALDSIFVSDASRFISGCLMCLSAMIQLELPHINLLTKCDMVPNKKALKKYRNPDTVSIIAELNEHTAGRYKKLNAAIGHLLEDYSMVSFLPIDVTDEDSLTVVLSHIDNAIQYGEDIEPKEPNDAVDVFGDDGAGDGELPDGDFGGEGGMEALESAFAEGLGLGGEG